MDVDAERARVGRVRQLGRITERINAHVSACPRCAWAHKKKKPAQHWCALSVDLHARAREIERELYPEER